MYSAHVYVYSPHRQFELGEGRHVNETHPFTTRLILSCHVRKPGGHLAALPMFIPILYGCGCNIYAYIHMCTVLAMRTMHATFQAHQSPFSPHLHSQHWTFVDVDAPYLALCPSHWMRPFRPHSCYCSHCPMPLQYATPLNFTAQSHRVYVVTGASQMHRGVHSYRNHNSPSEKYSGRS